MTEAVVRSRTLAFETALGTCALFWNDRGIREIAFSVAGGESEGGPPAPAWVQDVRDAILAHLSGRLQAFSWIPLDDRGLTPFASRVYTRLREVPFGHVTSYGELAARAGAKGAARAVGGALHRNPWLLVVPCHRVVGRGNIGGFSGLGGRSTKRRLLALEGIDLPEAWG